MDIGDWKIHSEPQDTETSAGHGQAKLIDTVRGGEWERERGGECGEAGRWIHMLSWGIWMDVDMKSVWQAVSVCQSVCVYLYLFVVVAIAVEFQLWTFNECMNTHTHTEHTHTLAATSGFHLPALHVSNGYVFSQAQDMDTRWNKDTHTHIHTTRLTHIQHKANTHTQTQNFQFRLARHVFHSAFPPHFSLAALVGFCFSFSFFTSLFRVFLHSIFVVIFFFVGTGKMNFRFVCWNIFG